MQLCDVYNAATDPMLPISRQADLQPDANRLVTVYRPRVDRCDRLWFVDTGMMEIPGKCAIKSVVLKLNCVGGVYGNCKIYSKRN